MKKFSLNQKFRKDFIVSNDKVKSFAEASEDKNPVHLDDNYASNTIFNKRIAHGLLVASFISAVLGNDFPGNGTIYLSQSLKFLAPVFIGDIITVEVEIIEIPRENRMKLKTNCKNREGKVVVSGEALVIPPVK